MKILLLLLISLFPIFVKSETNLNIKNIHIEGLYRISKNYIISKIPFYNLDKYIIKTSDISNLINSIMETKHFKYVKIILNNENNLTIKLEENPIIDSIEFNGNKIIKSNILKDVFIENDLYIGNQLNNCILFNIINKIHIIYNDNGSYGTDINIKYNFHSLNKVIIKVIINENKYSFIKKINFKENNNINTYKILCNIKSFNNINLISIFNRIFKFKYIEKKFDEDLKLIKNLYESNGYFDFYIKDKKITFFKNKNQVLIDLIIHEGNKYEIEEFDLVGDFDNSYYDDLKKILHKYYNNNIPNIKKISNIKNEIKIFLSDKGYSYPTIETKIISIKNSKKSKLQFKIECGAKIYVKNININGNNNTLDNIIRKEIHQSEYSPLNINLIFDDINRLNKLKLFDKINVKTSVVENATNKVNLLYNLDEIYFSGLKLGLSINENYKPNIKFNFMKCNLFGNNSLSFNVDYSSEKTNLEFIIDNIKNYERKKVKLTSKMFYYNNFKKSNTYKIFNINYGISNLINFPISDNFWSEYELIFNSNKIKINYLCHSVFKDFPFFFNLEEALVNNENSYNLYIPISFYSNDVLLFSSLNYENLNHINFPTEGKRLKLNLKYTLPIISDNSYYIANISIENYITDEFTNLTLFNKTQIYLINNLNKKNIPTSECNYFSDKLDLVRGFTESNDFDFRHMNYSDDPILYEDNIFSNLKISVKNELCLPTSLLINNYSDITRLSLFVDFGFETFSKKKISSMLDTFNLSNYEYMRHVHLSTGLTLRISSSVGMIDFSYIIPIKKCDGINEKVEKFQFNINKKW